MNKKERDLNWTCVSQKRKHRGLQIFEELFSTWVMRGRQVTTTTGDHTSLTGSCIGGLGSGTEINAIDFVGPHIPLHIPDEAKNCSGYFGE